MVALSEPGPFKLQFTVPFAFAVTEGTTTGAAGKPDHNHRLILSRNQLRVQPGQELIIKVSDPNYFARTRAVQMPVTLTVPSGDREIIKLEKNPVSVNLRLRYTYRPDSDLFVIYNLGSQFNSIAAGKPVLLREQRLTVKLTYSFLR